MRQRVRTFSIAAGIVVVAAIAANWLYLGYVAPRAERPAPDTAGAVSAVTVHRAIRFDISERLAAAVPRAVAETRLQASAAFDSAEDDFPKEDIPENALAPERGESGERDGAGRAGAAPDMTTLPGSGEVEQKSEGTRAAATLAASFDGLGEGFTGPQGTARMRNPSDNSLALGPDHIVQTVNSRMAIFTKKGKKYDTTGKVLYGPVETNNVFRGFGGGCDERNNGDAVVRYDQLANRWLVVMPIFSRLPLRPDEPAAPQAHQPASESQQGRPGQPGKAQRLYEPAPPPPSDTSAQADDRLRAQQRAARSRDKGSYAMCYAVSQGSDPFGPYYRYEFVRPLFPDYPRPAVWPDGYYVPTSTGDQVIQKHACVVDRLKMLQGQPATEQCVIIDSVNFLNNADLDGKQLPPAGAPNIMLAAGGTQLRGRPSDDAIYVWKYHVDWADPSKTSVTGPEKLAVAPYYYLCGGQLTSCVPQPGTGNRLDAQGDKIMSRVVYRRIGDRESIVAVHSVNTTAGGGGVRWYELRLDSARDVRLFQQGTFAPDSSYR